MNKVQYNVVKSNFHDIYLYIGGDAIMTTISLKGNPYSKQIEFFKSTKRYIAYGGA